MSNDQEEEFRLCPTCRMSISVWATKCRYCGETVGRPKREETHFTVKDLGGQPQRVYTLSGNVTDALESFRVEEATSTTEVKRSQAAKRKSWIQRALQGGAKDEPKRGEPGLPELDEYHRGLFSDSGRPSATGRRRPSDRSELLQRAIKLTGIVLVLVCLGFAADFGWSRLSAYLAARNAPPAEHYNSQAGAWLADGSMPIADIFVEAQTAYEINQTEEDRKILEEAREKLIAEVRALLARTPFDKSNLDQASKIMSRAMTKAGPQITALNDEVRSEMAYHNMTLTEISGTTAKFKLNNPAFGAREQVVSVGDLVQDRFQVERIQRDSVVLVDTKPPQGAPNRKLGMERHAYPQGIR